MGVIADSMLSGEVCEACGVWIGSGDMGIPMYCSKKCAKDRGVQEEDIKHRVRNY